jgi:hypothetical protein
MNNEAEGYLRACSVAVIFHFPPPNPSEFENNRTPISEFKTEPYGKQISGSFSTKKRKYPQTCSPISSHDRQSTIKVQTRAQRFVQRTLTQINSLHAHYYINLNYDGEQKIKTGQEPAAQKTCPKARDLLGRQ